MAYTELVANIGFKFKGAGELKQLEDTLKSVADLAKEISGSLGGSGSKSGLGLLGKKLAAFGAEIDSFKATGFAGIRSQLRTITATSGSWEEFGGAVGKMAGRILPVVGLVANVASAATDLVVNLTQAGIEAANLRNSLQINARGMGTSAVHLDALSRMYESMGLSADTAQKQFGEFSKKLNESLDSGKTLEWLSSLGIKPEEGDTRRDTAEVMTEALSTLAERIARNQEVFDKAPPGEGREKLAKERDQLWEMVRKNFGNDTLGVMQKGGGAAAWKNAKEEGVARRQLRTPEDEALAERVSQAATELQQKLALFADTWERLEMTVADILLPPLNFVLDKVTALAKTLGLVRKTPGELRAEQEAQENKQKRLEDVNALGSDYSATVKVAKQIGGSEVGAEQAKSVVGYANLLARLKEQYASVSSPESRANKQEQIEAVLAKFTDALKALQAVRPDVLQGISQDTVGRKAEVMKNNSDNDQRRFSFETKVTVSSLSQVAAAIDNRNRMVVGWIKASNSVTA